MATRAETPKRPRAVAQREAEYERMLMVKELEWLRTLAHVAPVGIFRVDPGGRLIYVNERWCEVTGRSANQAVGQSWGIGVHPDDLEALKTEWHRCVAERVPYEVEHRYVHPNGRIVWVLTRAVREVDGRGQTLGYTGMTTEVTELHQIREELQRSHQALEVRMRARAADLQRMARIVETIDDAVVSSDLAGRVLTWNRAAETIFGYTESEMIGQSVLFLAPVAVQSEARRIEESLRTGQEVHRWETMAVAKSGQTIELALSAFPLRDESGVICGTWAIARDISGLKTAERRLHRLSWRLMKAQDEERRRIARNLHDSTAQALAALSMNLAALAREDSPLPAERRRQLLQDSAVLADQATSELRTTSYLLHPPLLDERGLRSALGWFIDGFTKRSSIAVKLDVAADFPRLPTDIETTLFSVAQEALHNVHRHSGSDVASLSLALERGVVRLEIRDRGRGVESPLPEGVGIAGMRERLLQFGGALEVEPANPGTRVTALLPLA